MQLQVLGSSFSVKLMNGKICWSLLWLLRVQLPTSVQMVWIEVWSDEFDYIGQPDAHKWTHDLGGGGWGNNEAQYYTSGRLSNAQVKNGNLKISPRKDAVSAGVSNVHAYTSARLTTKNAAIWGPGSKIEARLKCPQGRGLWSAFWLLPRDSAYGVWPKSGEVDIMENVGHTPAEVHYSVHTELTNHLTRRTPWSESVPDADAAFHVYSIEWLEDRIIFLRDHVQKFVYRRPTSFSSSSWPFDQSFYIILNVAVGGVWGGMMGIDDSILTGSDTNSLLVDYVRVFRRRDITKNHYFVTLRSKDNCHLTGIRCGSVNVSPKSIGSYTRGTRMRLSITNTNDFWFVGAFGDNIQYSNYRTHDVALRAEFDHHITMHFARYGEILHNFAFMWGMLGWNVWNVGPGLYSVEQGLSQSAVQLKVAVVTPSINVWDKQIVQLHLNIQRSRSYTVRVTGSFISSDGSTAKNVNVYIDEPQPPWRKYFSRSISLGKTPQAFEFNFTMSHLTDSSARFVMDIGTPGLGDVYLESVSVVDHTLMVQQRQLYQGYLKSLIMTTRETTTSTALASSLKLTSTTTVLSSAASLRTSTPMFAMETSTSKSANTSALFATTRRGTSSAATALGFKMSRASSVLLVAISIFLPVFQYL